MNKVLPVIKEATAKERAMMGSRGSAGAGSLKRKREPDAADETTTDYFFAKFLTSPDLLDLEVNNQRLIFHTSIDHLVPFHRSQTHISGGSSFSSYSFFSTTSSHSRKARKQLGRRRGIGLSKWILRWKELTLNGFRRR